MKEQVLDMKAKGLFTHPNQLADIPPGGMVVAKNVVVNKEGITETRRGFNRYGTVLSEAPTKFYNYQDRLLVHHGTTLSYDSDNAGTWTNFSGSYSPPSGAGKIYSVAANRNFYFTTNAGIKKLTAYNGTVSSAGGIKGLDGSGVTTGATGWMNNNSSVAYRIVWAITDANNNKILGSPSQRMIVTNNSGGTRNVNFTFLVPAGVTTSYVYQIYRSAMTAAASDEPTDELFLVVEKNPTAGEITAGSVTYLDQTPETLLGATLYTSPSQQGITQANEPPPLARDLATYKNITLYANTVSKQRLSATLISVGGTVGIVIGDTVTVDGVAYTGAAAENVAANQFLVYSAGTVSENIDTTARSLVRVINRSASNTTIYAYYASGFDDLPGQMLFEERGIGGAAFVATSSRGGAFSPQLPSSGTTYTSVNDTFKNAVYASKESQPEAVPIGNVFYVGSADEDILRIIALRDSTFVIKRDGVFRITGETVADLRVSLFDSTVRLIAPDSAVPFNNRITGMTDQTIAAISDSGISIISRPIENTLFRLSSSQFTAFPDVTTAVAYESDREYILSTLTNTTDTVANHQYVYNSATAVWTEWQLPMSAGIISDADGRLYWGSNANNYVYRERKSFDLTDYADEEFPVNIVGNVVNLVEVTSTANVAVGDSLVQYVSGYPSRAAIITAINDATHVTVGTEFNWSPGLAYFYRPITATIQWAPVHAGNPSMIKQWESINILISNAVFESMDLACSSDFSSNDDEWAVMPIVEGPWGEFPWGTAAWGGDNLSPQNIKTLPPFEKTRSHWLNLRISQAQAFTSFSILGVSFFFRKYGDRQK